MKTLHAGWLVPGGNAQPVANVRLEVSAGRVVRVSPCESEDADAGVTDYSHCIVCPGLINSHAHLELSNHRVPLGEPGTALPEWLKGVIASRNSGPQANAKTDEEINERNLAALANYQAGLRESIQYGVTTVVDIVQEGWSPEWLLQQGPRVLPLLELRGFGGHRQAGVLQAAEEFLRGNRLGFPMGRLAGMPGLNPATRELPRGLSPHAPYSLGLATLAGLSSQSLHVPCAMHLGESAEELEFLQTGEGPFRALLEHLGAWDPGAINPPLDLAAYLELLQSFKPGLAVHGNYLSERAKEVLADQSCPLGLVHCPRTHAFFGHPVFRWNELSSAGVNLLLGTDSRASSPDLNLWADLRCLSPVVPLAELLQAATTRPAQILGFGNQLGELQPGFLADLAVFRSANWPVSDPWKALEAPSTQCVATWVGGELVFQST